ncbi:hypothetical protein A9Q84_15810 [Halobacteriovorax marinus]|uniref:Response regulatory domain-containing protein n=1 Tax=Halobacteriovorax marinus TaxID=97084 RepID=A0A1Y5F4L7_9BACT|nr:hypothetical protein A9Q84_15810 [Halobacteriovorax marinus]
MNIALVDDEVEVFNLFKMHFRKEIRSGLYNFFFFENGEECYEFLERNKDEVEILLILSDVNMPVMDGLTLLTLVHNNYGYVKVFMITAYETEELVSKANELGATGFLSKPLDFNQLKKQIKEIGFV